MVFLNSNQFIVGGMKKIELSKKTLKQFSMILYGRVCHSLFILLFSTASLESFTVLIDPGHGGIHTGPQSINNRFIEKDVVLTIAKKLRLLLKKAGFTVVLTRTNDSEFDKDLLTDLAKRASLTKTYKADIFVSLHLNQSNNHKVRWFEVYVPYENNKYPLKSYALASSIHYELSHKITPDFSKGVLKNINNRDGGIKAAAFNVLKKASCPSVLIELDFLSHPGQSQ